MNLGRVYEQIANPQHIEFPQLVRSQWKMDAFPGQVPVGLDRYQVIVGGRGAGKTRAGAEWIREKARVPNQRLLLVARTAADVRETLVEGMSGVMAITPEDERPTYKPSLRRLEWANGTQAFCTSWDEPGSLRGVQAHYTWLDEPGHKLVSAHPGSLDAFDNADLATRLGVTPQVLVTGTSQVGSSDLWDALADSVINLTPFRGSHVRMYHNKTETNRFNLPAAFVERVIDRYKGTAAEDRELNGLL